MKNSRFTEAQIVSIFKEAEARELPDQELCIAYHSSGRMELGGHLLELRWKNGWRVYFTKVQDASGKVVLLLLGGLKNAQKKDIERARFLIRRYTGD